jgi:hypothetical protein
MLRLRFAFIPLIALALLVAGTTRSFAAGAGAVSVTQHFHNATDSIVDVFPCSTDPSAPYTITLTYNGALHYTVLTLGPGAGTGWFTITQTGTFAATPLDPTSGLPSFTGHFTFWEGDNANLQNSTGTVTLTIKGTGSDGSAFSSHMVEHITVTPSGAQVSFDHLTCA